jgi:hypothetical protein
MLCHRHMHDDDYISDEILRDAVFDGNIRCLNARNSGTSVIRMSTGSLEFDHHIDLVRVMGTQELDRYYFELFKRASSLLAFIQSNVGETVEYPICVTGENAKAVDKFYNEVSDLEYIVGILTEI